jgi:DnaJ family protein A protein 5
VQSSGTGSGTGSGTATPNAAVAFVAQDWQKVAESGAADLEWALAEGDEEEEWECVACGKSFRSEAAWDSHERSKKHLKAVERLAREMAEEDETLGLTEDGAAADGRVADDDGSAGLIEEIEALQVGEESLVEDVDVQPASGTRSEADHPAGPQPPLHGGDQDVDFAPRSKKVLSKMKKPRAPSPEDTRPVRSTRRRGADRERQLNGELSLPPYAGPATGKQRSSVSIDRIAEQREDQGHTSAGKDEDADAGEANVASAALNGAGPELSKRDKRRAREEAKKAAAVSVPPTSCLVWFLRRALTAVAREVEHGSLAHTASTFHPYRSHVARRACGFSAVDGPRTRPSRLHTRFLRNRTTVPLG